MLAGMSAPLDFLRIFAGQLRQAGIHFAITSGMACVHYGLQQNTTFWMQHKRVVKAAHTHGLPPNPLADMRREDLVAAAVKRLAETGFPENDVAQVLPPIDELLP